MWIRAHFVDLGGAGWRTSNVWHGEPHRSGLRSYGAGNACIDLRPAPREYKFLDRREDIHRAMGYAKGVVRPGFEIVLCRHVSNLTLPGTHLPEPFI